MTVRSLRLMMTHRKAKICPAMTAIAAVLALSSPSFAQSADPTVAETPAPVADVTSTPAVPDALAPEPVAVDTAADPLAPKTVAKPASRKTTATKASAAAKGVAARSRPAPARTARAAPAAAPVAAIAPPVAAVAAPVAQPPAVEPLPVQAEAAPVAAPPADASEMDAMIPVAAGGGLAVLALVGAGLAMRRRRRRAEAEEAELRAAALAAAEPEPAITAEPKLQPMRTSAGGLGEPSFGAASTPAFVAGASKMAKAPPAVAAAAPEPAPPIDHPVVDLPEGVDVAPGSHVEAAYAGPTAENPSLSIKKRLKRAAFFDQREFLVEAGEAEPIALDAGLPDALEMPEPAPPAR